MVPSGMALRVTFASVLTAALLVAGAASAQHCTADVEVLERDGLRLDVTWRCKSDRAIEFTADGERSFRRVTEFRGKAAKTAGTNVWRVEPSGGAVEASYRFDLSAYARSVDQGTTASLRGEGALVLLSGWLLEPRGFGFNPTLDIRVRTPPGLVFATALPRVGDAWRLTGNINIRFAGYTAIGRLHFEEIDIPAPGALRTGAAAERGKVRFALLDGLSPYDKEQAIGWVKRSLEAQGNFWEGGVAREMLLGVVPLPGRGGTGNSRTMAGGGVTLIVEVGEQFDSRTIYREGVLGHELVHAGMPFLRGRGNWFMEGAATYFEPMIHARAGWRTEAEVWSDWVRQMTPAARAFEAGLSHVNPRQMHWAGATFMLLADLELRRESNGVEGLEDCLKGVLWSGLDGTQRISLEEYVAACDKATAYKAVSRLLARHSVKGKPLDVVKLWRDLGVDRSGSFKDDAPDAKWRKMIVFGNKPGNVVKRPYVD